MHTTKTRVLIAGEDSVSECGVFSCSNRPQKIKLSQNMEVLWAVSFRFTAGVFFFFFFTSDDLLTKPLGLMSKRRTLEERPLEAVFFVVSWPSSFFFFQEVCSWHFPADVKHIS